MIEDLFDAEEAIDARDSVQLWESDYFNHAKRWISEVSGDLSDEAYNTAEELRSEMFKYCVNDAQNSEKIQELSEDLSMQVFELKQRLELVEKIAEKAKEYNYLE